MIRYEVEYTVLILYIFLAVFYTNQNPNATHAKDSMNGQLKSSSDIDESTSELQRVDISFVKKSHLRVNTTVQQIMTRRPAKLKFLLKTFNSIDRNGKTTSKLKQVDRFNKQEDNYKYKIRNIEEEESDLGWSQWSEWTCSVTCGSGVGKRVRTCQNTGPNICRGPKEEEGPCNEQFCPDVLYTLSPETKFEADRKLRADIPGYLKKNNESIQLSCSSEMLNSIWSEYPNIKVSWLKNGKELDVNDTRVKLVGHMVKIKHLVADDSGVYICKADFAPRSSQAVSMFVLSIQSSHPTLTVTEKSLFTLTCNGFMLSRVLSNLNQKWIHNGSIYWDFQESSPLNHNELEINSASFSDSGVWECKITDIQSTRSWTTNHINVQIIPAQSFADKIRKHIVEIAIAAGGLLLLLCIIFLVPKWFKSSDTRQMEEELKRLQEKKKIAQESKKAEEIKLLQRKQRTQELKLQAEKSKPEPKASKSETATIKPSIKKPILNAKENVSKMLEKTFEDSIPFNAFGVNEYTLRMKYKETKGM